MAGAPSVTAAAVLVRCLENEGVRYVFGLPGEEILDLRARALDLDGPSLIEAPGDPAEALRLGARLGGRRES